MADIERDAARYRWIKAAPRLRIERMPDSHFWISAETGKKYSVTHCLSAFDTGFSGLPTLDELVDQAMEMYPIPDEVKPKQREDLWRRIGSKAGSYNLGPVEIANILELIAEEVEHRGTIDYDRDPGETAEWLMHEAQSARQSMNP